VIGRIGPENSSSSEPGNEGLSNEETGMAKPNIAPNPHDTVQALEYFRPSGNKDQDVKEFLRASGRNVMAEGLDRYPSVNRNRLLALIMDNRERLTAGDTASFTAQIRPDSSQYQTATAHLGGIPRAEINAINRIYTSHGIDRRALRVFRPSRESARASELLGSRWRDPNSSLESLWQADPALKGGPELGRSILEAEDVLSEIKVRLDTYSNDILNLETQLDMVMSELSRRTEIFETQVPAELVDTEFFRLKSEYEQMYKGVKETLENLFLQVQSVRDSFVSKAFSDKERAKQPDFKEGIRGASLEAFALVETTLHSCQEFVTEMRKKVESLEI